MEGKIPLDATEATSAPATFTPDHNSPMQGEFLMKDEDGGGKNPVLAAVQLDLEMEKRKIREQIIASEILRQRELEAEVRMELMMEKQIMGMRRFYGASSVDPFMLMNYGFLGFQGGSLLHKNLLNVGSSDDEFSEKLKLISHPVGGVDDVQQINPDPHKDNVCGDGEKQQIHDVNMGKWPFQRDPNLVAAQIAGKSMVEIGREEVVGQGMPSLGLSGMKRKAEAPTVNDEETVSIATSKAMQKKKWYCSLCEVSATSAGGWNLHLHGKKHKAKEKASLSTESHSTENSMQPVEQAKSQEVQPMEEEKSQGQHVEEEKSKEQPMEEDKSQVQPMEEDKSQVQPMEEEKSHVTKKWECSLCQLVLTSEILLTSHLQGKKHKAKAAKLGICQETSESKEKNEDVKKWYCSLCQVSAASEKNLNDHLQGKKHKAKAGLLHQEADTTVDSNSAEKISEDENLEGEKALKIEQEMISTSEKKEESRCEESIEETEELEKSGEEMRRGVVKFWDCKMCNKGTYDEAAIIAHRKSSKHMNLLRKIGGGLIVVSNVLKEEVEGEKLVGSEDEALNGIENENGNTKTDAGEETSD